MIPDDVVEEVRARADIVDVVSEFVPDLKKSGKDYKAKCPFHEDRTPSFYVVPAKGFYKCFGCGESGDAFTFVMKKVGLDFVEAVKYVGARCGVDVQEVRRERPEEDPFRPMYEANAFARDFFTRQLWDTPAGAAAREYLAARGVGRDTADRFGVGFAPDEWHALGEAAGHHGMTQELLLEVGLLTTSERSSEPYDRFRNRIIFPIEDISGRVVAFGGRILGRAGKGSPKYLNSPETPIYHKGRVLYGLNWARHAIRREESVLVTEGYMDVVSCAAAGIETVVATLGTALTEEHARLLKRYCSRAFLLFDSDLAGLRATFRAGDLLLGEGFQVSVVTFPPGEDPDSVAHAGGAAGVREYLDQAVDLLDRELQILEEKGYFSDISKTRTAVDRLLPTLRAAADPALRDLYVAKVADRTGIRPETLLAEMEEVGHTGGHRPAAQSRREGRSGRSPGPRPTGPGRTLPTLGPERQLLLLLTKDRTWVERAAERIGPGDLVDLSYRVIFQALVDDPELRHAPPDMAPEPTAVLEELLGSRETLGHGGRVFEDSVVRIQRSALDRRMEDLRLRIRGLPDGPERDELSEELSQARAEREGMGRDWASAWGNIRRHAQDGSEPSDG
jgi:DNA primase